MKTTFFQYKKVWIGIKAKKSFSTHIEKANPNCVVLVLFSLVSPFAFALHLSVWVLVGEEPFALATQIIPQYAPKTEP